MAKLSYKEFEQGSGFVVEAAIPPAGLLPLLRTSRKGRRNLFRFSTDGGATFTQWQYLDNSSATNFGRLTDKVDIILEVITEPTNKRDIVRAVIDPHDTPASSVFYDKSIFKTFFESNDTRVLGWAINVLEKLFEPNVIPLYISRNNEDDYNAFFLAITQFFAFIVIYARQFRQIENSDILLKKFLEEWGIVYENIDTADQRAFLFKNWINQFYERGTRDIAAKEELNDDGSIKRLNGELRRLVGYTQPNEFIFAVLTPQDIGWCLGWSSPTWYGTETVNAVSKGYDYGPVFSGSEENRIIRFSSREINLPKEGDEVTNELITDYDWELQVGSDVNVDFEDATARGVGKLADYPIIGTVERKFSEDMFVFELTGTGRCGIDPAVDFSKLMEVYPGLDYEINVWVKALDNRAQNLEFGVRCYDGNFKLIDQVRITDFTVTNSFMEGDQYQNPCKVPGHFYRLSGIIFNILAQREDTLYLNFENGRPLRFMGDVKYMAPYIVQDRTGDVTSILISGITLKPLYLHVEYDVIDNRSTTEDLPYPAQEYSYTKDGKFTVLRAAPTSQGYLGQPNVIAMYAQIKSARTKKDIEEFVNRYLVSYKNTVSYTWLDWVVRTSWFLTFYVKYEVGGAPIAGATVTLSNGVSAVTDATGYARFEVQDGTEVTWHVESKGIFKDGKVTMTKDQTVNVSLNIPLTVNVDIVEEGWGTVNVQGSKLPNSMVTLIATPSPGYLFVKYVITPGGTEIINNPAEYWLSLENITVQAIFERSGELHFSPASVTIPANGGIGTITASSTKHWELDPLPATWASVSPTEGDTGDTVLRIEIDEEGKTK